MPIILDTMYRDRCESCGCKIRIDERKVIRRRHCDNCLEKIPYDMKARNGNAVIELHSELLTVKQLKKLTMLF